MSSFASCRAISRKFLYFFQINYQTMALDIHKPFQLKVNKKIKSKELEKHRQSCKKRVFGALLTHMFAFFNPFRSLSPRKSSRKIMQK